MSCTKCSIRLCRMLLILNVVFIWGNSLMPREVSSAFSKLVGEIVGFFLGGSMDAAEGEGQGILRKVAHFTEFCTLGMLLSWWVRMRWAQRRRYFWIPLLAGTSVAAVDELIQQFVPGRGPGIRDVAIDTAGVLLGIALMALLVKCRKKCARKDINTKN